MQTTRGLTPRLYGHASALTGRPKLKQSPKRFMAGNYAKNYSALAWSAPMLC